MPTFKHLISDIAPASAATTVGSHVGVSQYDCLMIVAQMQPSVSGALDVYLQSTTDGGTTWFDYAHFSQMAANAGATIRMLNVSRQGQATTPVAVGTGSAVALAAGTCVGGNWGDELRAVYVTGANTGSAIAQHITIAGWHTEQ